MNEKRTPGNGRVIPGKTRIISLLAVLFLFSLFRPVHADSGPKPSVHVLFENVGDTVCYGTLLSRTESTGPACADSFNRENYERYGNGMTEDEWRGFIDYQDADGFFFLQRAWKIDKEHSLDWTYYPPQTFKVLLYFPETGRFAVSRVMDRTAFSSWYIIDLKAWEKGGDTDLEIRNGYRFGTEALKMAGRLLLTILLELLVGLLFRFRSKRQIRRIVLVNIITQVLLNLVLFWADFRYGPQAFVFACVLMELFIVLAEAIAYTKLLPEKEPGRMTGSTGICWLYSLTANAVSFAAGLLIPFL